MTTTEETLPNSFIFFYNWYEAITQLEDSEQLEVYKSIMEYVFNENNIEDNMSKSSSALFKVIRPILDHNQEKYLAKIKRYGV